MNVLLLTQYFAGSLEGSASVFTIIAELLANNGHKVWVITNNVEGVDYPQHENIKIMFVSKPLQVQGTVRTTFKDTIGYIFSSIKAGRTIVKEEKIDIIHSNAISALAGSWLSVITSKPHITTVHDLYSTDRKFWSEWVKQKGNSRWKAFLGRLFEKIVIKSKCAAIHTVSQTSRDDLVKFGAKKPIYVIHNAIPITEAEDSKTNPFQFIYVGRLVFYKNIQTTIKAIKIVKESYPMVTLILVGRGPYREELEKLVVNLDLQENVIFKGHVSEEEKIQLLAKSQALIFPSLFEGFGLVILEAFLQKKPVLVSSVRPIIDIVEHQKTGLVISAEDENEWGKAIKSILSDKENASKMGLAGRKELEKKYSLDVMWERLLAMYNDFL